MGLIGFNPLGYWGVNLKVGGEKMCGVGNFGEI